MRLFGIIMLALAGFLAWHSNWFHAEKDLSRYRKIRLAYTDCEFERIMHCKGSTTKQIVFITQNGHDVMEDGSPRRLAGLETLVVSRELKLEGWISTLCRSYVSNK